MVDVVDEGERIAHVLAGAAGRGRGGRARIDWARRFDHMQQHTGQHLLSAVFAELFGHETVSVHFGAECATLDLERLRSSTREQLAGGRAARQRARVENRPVAVTVRGRGRGGRAAQAVRAARARCASSRSTASTAARAAARTCAARRDRVGAAPRRRAGARQATRVEFVCGGRALRRAREDHALLTRLALDFSARPEEVPALAAGCASGSASCARRSGARKRSWPASVRARCTSRRPGRGRRAAAVERRPAGGLEELRALAHAFTALPKAVLVAAVDEPPALLLAASEDSGVNAGAALKAALAEAGGRGGGSPRIAQGSVPDRGRSSSVIRTLGGSAGRLRPRRRGAGLLQGLALFDTRSLPAVSVEHRTPRLPPSRAPAVAHRATRRNENCVPLPHSTLPQGNAPVGRPTWARILAVRTMAPRVRRRAPCANPIRRRIPCPLRAGHVDSSSSWRAWSPHAAPRPRTTRWRTSRRGRGWRSSRPRTRWPRSRRRSRRSSSPRARRWRRSPTGRSPRRRATPRRSRTAGCPSRAARACTTARRS